MNVVTTSLKGLGFQFSLCTITSLWFVGNEKHSKLDGVPGTQTSRLLLSYYSSSRSHIYGGPGGRPSRLFPHASRRFPRDGPLVLCEGSSTAFHFAKVPSRQSSALMHVHESPSEVQSTWGVVEAAREVGVTYKLWLII